MLYTIFFPGRLTSVINWDHFCFSCHPSGGQTRNGSNIFWKFCRATIDTLGGLLICSAGDHTVRLLPPLISTQDELAHGIEILGQSL